MVAAWQTVPEAAVAATDHRVVATFIWTGGSLILFIVAALVENVKSQRGA